MVEMVVVTPLLLLLVLGVGEIGKAIIEYNTLTKSVRDAARLVAGRGLLGTTGTVMVTPDLEAEVKNLVVFGNAIGSGAPLLKTLSTDHVSVSVADAANNLILVQADFPYDPLIGPALQSFGYGSETSMTGILSASVVMRAL